MPTGWIARALPPELEEEWLARGLWDDDTIGQVLARGLTSHPEQTFRVFSATHPWTGTYADLHRRALQLAGGLRARGIGPGDPIAFQLPNWVEAAVSFYAAAYLGAVVVPIVHFYGPKEVGYILRKTGVRALLTARSFGAIDYLANLEQLAGPDHQQALDGLATIAVLDLDEPMGRIEPFAALCAAEPIDGPVAVDPASPALIAYTSGTTADPKGVVHSHRTLGCEVRQLGATHPEGSPPALVGLPVGHAMGMLGALLMPVTAGRPVNLIDVWDPARVLALMAEHGLSSGTGAAYFLTSLLDHPDLRPEHLELMRYVGMGGSAVPAAVTERATAEGISVVRMYGSTEHPSITGGTHAMPLEKRLHTDGRPMDGVEIRLLDDDGRPVGAGVPGEIFSRGPDCCTGYTDAALTEFAFDAEGWFRTEDIGVLDEDGYLCITDRKKDIIIRGGENVSAAEVEELVARLPGVAEVAVVAAPDERLGEQVCAFVRVLPGTEPPTLASVRAALAEQGLARQKWPELLRLTDELPRTPSGKVKKAELRRLLRDGAA